MNKRYYRAVCCICVILLCRSMLYSQERVYISTDKEYYLAGESIWCSVYCTDESSGQHGIYSNLSSVAYIEFHNREGLAATIKTALINGRGCGRFEIPFSVPTGNYSVLAYTRYNGGDSKSEHKGKIVTIFNTLTNERVKDGVEIAGTGENIRAVHYIPKIMSRDLSVEIPGQSGQPGELFPLKLKNAGSKEMSLNISVYHADDLTRLIGETGYDNTSLTERRGEFERTGNPDYEGEVIKARISLTDQSGTPAVLTGKYIFMSAMAGPGDIYIAHADSSGTATFYTENIYGHRDLVFDIAPADTSLVCRAEIITPSFKHRTAEIPVLKISPDLSEALSGRSQRMQIAKRFESDTLFDLLPFRTQSLLKRADPAVYNLDEYTRFPLMVEVVREYIKEMRIRKFNGKDDFQILIADQKKFLAYSEGNTLVLLDGVPVQDHSKLAKIDPLLVKQIVIYNRQFAIGTYKVVGIVNFITYKGDMGGIQLAKHINIVNYKGVQYPLAICSNKISGDGSYPDYNETIYWNPVVNLKKNETLEIQCQLPQYKGKFRIVIEGLDANGNGVYYTTSFTL